MNRLLKKQLEKYIGKSYDSDLIFKSKKLQKLLSAIDNAYEYNDQERRLLERTIDLNSKELNLANKFLLDHF